MQLPLAVISYSILIILKKNIEKLNALLCQTPGIVEHGIFYNIAHGALISSNGKVREIWKN